MKQLKPTPLRISNSPGPEQTEDHSQDPLVFSKRMVSGTVNYSGLLVY